MLHKITCPLCGGDDIEIITNQQPADVYNPRPAPQHPWGVLILYIWCNECGKDFFEEEENEQRFSLS